MVFSLRVISFTNGLNNTELELPESVKFIQVQATLHGNRTHHGKGFANRIQSRQINEQANYESETYRCFPRQCD